MAKLKPFLKPLFEERMRKLLNDKKDFVNFIQTIQKKSPNYIRCNTLKISPEKLRKNLEKKGWKILQPFEDHEEIMIIDSKLAPGEIGRAREHILGYYYVQELSSQLPLLIFDLKQSDFFLDCCAAPGSKTTQAAAIMKNRGMIIANDNSLGRIKILASNLERCGVSNCIITRDDAEHLSNQMIQNTNIKFDKILADVPCSGEGTLRSSLMASKAWNLKVIKKFSRNQKRIASAALKALKTKGEMIYSTCTHSPEENEEVVDYLIKNYDLEIIEIKNKLPIKARAGLTKWNGQQYNSELKKTARIYPQDNNTEGFFIAKIKKLSDKKKKK